MKRLSIAIAIIACSLSCFSQALTPVKRLYIRDSIYIDGHWFKKVSTNLSSPDSLEDFTLVTAKAVADFIRTKAMGGPGGGGTPSGGTTNIQLNYSNQFASTSRFQFDSTFGNLFIGRDNEIPDQFLGEDYSSYNIIMGVGNTASNFMKRSILSGDNNIVSAPYFDGNIFLFGNNNFADAGSHKYGFGDNLNLYGDFSYAFGDNLQVGVYGWGFGKDNVAVNRASVFGQSMVGLGLLSKTSGWSLITGIYNDTTGAAGLNSAARPIAFQIGNGTSNASRSNAFSILRDGTLITPKYKNNATGDSLFVPDQNGEWMGILKSSIGQNYSAGNGTELVENQFRIGNLTENTSLSGNFSFLRSHKSFRITAADSVEWLTTACSGCYVRMTANGKTQIGSGNQVELSGNVAIAGGSLDMGMTSAAGLPRLAGDPASSYDGMVYYNTTTHTFRKKENGSWSNWSDGSGVVSSFNGRTGAVVPAINDYTWQQINKSTSNIADIATRNFADLQNKPTTLAGYGITDPIALTSGSYANPSWITSLAWSKITSTPTTFAGYGLSQPVMSVSTGNLSPLFSTSTSTGANPSISFSFNNAPANTLFGNITGSAASPSYIGIGDIANALPEVNLRLGGSIKKTTSFFGDDSLHLDGDEASPADGKIYGKVGGAKGWYTAAELGIEGGGGGAVSSVFGRTDDVVAQANDYAWDQINKATSSLGDLTTRSAGDLNSGTLPDARLSSNVPLKNALNTFTNHFMVDNANLIVNGGNGNLQLNDQVGGWETFIRRNNGALVVNARQTDFSFRDVLHFSLVAPTNSLYLDNSGRLGFGGGTSSFPGLVHNGTKLEVKLANGSAYTDLTVKDDAYNASSWDGNQDVPTKNAFRDKIESLFTESSYTPTSGSSDLNLDAVTFSTTYYSKVGSTVTVWGSLSVDATSSGATTIISFNLPVASDFTSTGQLSGTGARPDVAGEFAAIRPNITNDQVEIVFIANNLNSSVLHFRFTYKVL